MTLSSVLGRVTDLIKDHPDVDHVDWSELREHPGSKVVHRFEVTPTVPTIAPFYFELSDATLAGAWKDVEELVKQRLNDGLATSLKAEDSPTETYTRLRAANVEAKDLLFGAPTDHPVVLALRVQYREAAVNLLMNTPPSRRRSKALTDLEQSLMWATKAVYEKD